MGGRRFGPLASVWNGACVNKNPPLTDDYHDSRRRRPVYKLVLRVGVLQGHPSIIFSVDGVSGFHTRRPSLERERTMR